MKIILNRLINNNGISRLVCSSSQKGLNYSTLTSLSTNKFSQVEYFTKHTQILKNTVLLEFNNHKTLCNSFIRIQEFYENDKYFQKKINFSDLELNNYYTSWLGFNLPMLIIKKFNSIYTKEELTKFELNLLDLINNINLNSSDFYLIATSSANPHLKETLKHETCHALYYLDEEFRGETIEVLNTIPAAEMTHLNQLMRSLNYHESVWKDEIQAYLISESFNSPVLLSRGVPIYTAFWQSLISKLNKIYFRGVKRNKINN